MKKLLTVLLLSMTIISVSQNCKYEKNDIDKFTGKMTKLTNDIKFFESSKSVGFIRIQKEDTKFQIIFVCDGSFNVRKSIKDGSELSFLLENNKAIILKKSDGNVYSISQTDLMELMQNKTKSCRFEYESKKGEKVVEDVDIKKGKAVELTDLIKCVL